MEVNVEDGTLATTKVAIRGVDASCAIGTNGYLRIAVRIGVRGGIKEHKGLSVSPSSRDAELKMFTRIVGKIDAADIGFILVKSPYGGVLSVGILYGAVGIGIGR